jgi:integrase/recombinase XerD
MNRISPGLSLSKARVGFEQYKAAEGLSPNTLVNYSYHLKLWQEYISDVPIDQVTTQGLRAFLAWLRTDYKPRRLCGGDDPLSPKTVRNFWVTLSAFFSWACDEFDIPNPMKGVPAPRFEDAPVESFSKEQVEALLKAAEYCREADTTDRRKFTMRRATARRDCALIMILLDTGLRASELCSLKIGDIDQKTGRVQVRHGVGGGAKFKKGRVVFLGKATRRAVWRYLAEREDSEDPEAPLFLGKFNRPMNKDVLRQLIASLGKKAGVKKCHPHRFRHTFAITYLRAGGDLFTLQALLGHSSLDMVRRYARIAETDIQQAHRRASPADNWHL